MIRENQVLLNRLNVLTDGLIVFGSFLLGYVVRFNILRDGIKAISFRDYAITGLLMALVHLAICTMLGLYETDRKKRLYEEIGNVFAVSAADMVLLMMGLYLIKSVHYPRLAFAAFFVFETGFLSAKRIIVTLLLRRMRAQGYNIKSILIAGSGVEAKACVGEINRSPELGYRVLGYVSNHREWRELDYLGDYSSLDARLAALKPDEVIAGLRPDEYAAIPQIINDCERNGIKLSLIPFYVQYMPSQPQFDSLNGIPMLNLRRIPLDNIGNAFIKRAMDIAGAAALIVFTSPLMLIAAIGVKLSSPGPVIFRQERMGLNQKTFTMYKFRSMAVNTQSDTAWSTNADNRKTPFGAFIRKFSIDELPQFFNVLKGDMSLVGPRPEIPHHVEHFREEIPLYMVKHQVKPGITGWAQIHGLRGDTSVEERVRHDIWYIENWSFWLDIRILFMTLGSLTNREQLKAEDSPAMKVSEVAEAEPIPQTAQSELPAAVSEAVEAAPSSADQPHKRQRRRKKARARRRVQGRRGARVRRRPRKRRES